MLFHEVVGMILKRKMYDTMLEWKKSSNGRTALLIDGARRVGKSFLVRQFGQTEYKSMIMVDFANISKEITDLIENESYDLDLFFIKLCVFYRVQLYRRDSLIVFDEVQLCPKARQLIKYLVADGRYDFIETGSLISLKQNVKDIVIPSEEEHVSMYPMDFEEYLWAMSDTVTAPLLLECFNRLAPLGQALHRKIMNDFRQYMLVGGMPQAVLEYADTKDFAAVDKVKRTILTLYRNDIVKFANGSESRVTAIFDGIPGQLARKEKRYKLSSLSKSARNRSYENAFVWLSDAMIVNSCFNSTDPNVGLGLSRDDSTQKCYMADTGLLVTHAFWENKYADNELYRTILFDRLNINEGMIMENYAAQALRMNGHRLYFYSRRDRENKDNNMEIDFLLSKGKGICPIEVKSSAYQKHSSLDKFMTKFKTRIATPYILYQKDICVKDGVAHLPVYMAMCL